MAEFLELDGKVMLVSPIETRTSKDGYTWRRQMFVITVGAYEKKVCIWIKKSQLIDELNIQEGDFVNIKVNPESREYEGKWFTELIAWRGKIVKRGNTQTITPTSLPESTAPAKPVPPKPSNLERNYQRVEESNNDNSDLPF